MNLIPVTRDFRGTGQCSSVLPMLSAAIIATILLISMAASPPLLSARTPEPAGRPSPASRSFVDALDPSEREWLRLNPVVRVGGPLAFQPFYFHDEDGAPQGMAFDFLRLVLGTIGLEMEPVPAQPWPQVLDAARDRGIDLIACAARSPEREDYLVFSDPVLSFPMVIVGRKDGPFISGLEDLRGLRVALVRGNVAAEWLARDAAGFVPKEVATPLDALNAVSLGTADAHIENLAAASYLIEKYGLANLKVAAPTPYGNYDLHFAVRKDWPELASIINKALRSLEPGQRADIRQSWLAVRFEHGLRPRDVVKWFTMAGIPVLAVFVTLFVGYRRLVREVAGRAQTEQALRSECGRSLRYLDTVQTMIVALDTAGSITMINRAGREMLGYGEEELLGRNWFEFCLPQPEGGETIFPRFRDIVEGGLEGSLLFENNVLRKDGTLRLIGWRNTYLRDENGRIAGVLSSGEDITERRQAEEGMKAAMESLREAKAAAEAANVAKSEFLANMSHEIRTPVNGVMGMLQALQTTPLSPEQDDYASKAVQSCKRLASLLGDILDLSRIEAGKLPLTPAPMDIADLFEQVRDLFRAVASDRGVRLRFSADPPQLPRILGDAARLQQILVNLVGNALKFTEAGEVSVLAQALPSRHPGHCRILFSVTDTGIGIPDEKLSLLFKPFSQAHGGYAREHQGAGLGLSICKRLVDLMGGTMTVTSEPDLGTTVAFCLNFAVDASRTSPKPPRDSRRIAGLQGRRILLAEDDPVSAMAGKMLLIRHGADVIVAQDGKQVLQALEQAPFDLVLMDVQMPFMDGVETTMAIRSGLAGTTARDIPIIAMTAYAMAGDREKFLKAGMDAYIAKPMSVSELLEVIADSLHA